VFVDAPGFLVLICFLLLFFFFFFFSVLFSILNTKYALVFGINTFFGLLAQTVIQLVCSSPALAISILDRFVIYGVGWHLVLPSPSSISLTLTTDKSN